MSATIISFAEAQRREYLRWLCQSQHISQEQGLELLADIEECVEEAEAFFQCQ